jgi:hypothetical protein
MAYYGEDQFEYVPRYYALGAGHLYHSVSKGPSKLLCFFISQSVRGEATTTAASVASSVASTRWEATTATTAPHESAATATGHARNVGALRDDLGEVSIGSRIELSS